MTLPGHRTTEVSARSLAHLLRGVLERSVSGIAQRAYRAGLRTPLRKVLVGPIVLSIRERFLAFGPDQVIQVIDALARCSVDVWVIGGWGIDALAGRETRRHRDLDLVVGADVEKIRRCLEGVGFRLVGRDFVATSSFPHRVLMQDARGRWIDLHPLEGPTSPRKTQTVSLAPADVTLGKVAGRPVPCLSAQYQWRLLNEGIGSTSENRHHLAQLRRGTDGFDAERRLPR